MTGALSGAGWGVRAGANDLCVRRASRSALDLALLPAFWNLPRRAHEAAIAALHDANRGRDATALTATVRTRFRPSALRAINLSPQRPEERLKRETSP